MKVKVFNWTINKLYGLKDQINAQPVYQRGEVWKESKNRLLIDSILRGIDIPKIYLRKLNQNGAYKYEVADGQQRINAIYKFFEGDLYLESRVVNGLDLSKIKGYNIGEMDFNDNNFPVALITAFKNYKLTIAIVEKATGSEIRTLFGRLQLGEPLVPAEKRNAIISKAGTIIDTFATTHNFFVHSRIPQNRYKHQDYLAHVFALIEYNNSEALKAELLQKLYLEKNPKSISFNRTIANILDIMHQVDIISRRRIINKFAFIDIFWFLFNVGANKSKIDVVGFADKFDEFEKARIKNNKNPERLIKGKKPSVDDKSLFNYITSFNLAGALTESIDKRHSSIKHFFKNFIN